ncbi:RNA pyrophosphohydrolase [Streptomyces sp. enrichment culture]|uniref:NUDIX hydrolase n=1 Tax=Streptomyces sp. enrichment culture TaxID=1795815 RepID=UPI003F56A141
MTETTSEKPGISAAIIVKDDKVLMVRRRVSEGELMWQFPAGAIEPGEAAEDAAVRETAEETGLVVTSLRLLGERVHPKTQRLMSYTACEPVQGEARVADEEELDAVAWVSHSEITDYVPYPLYEKVQEYLDDVLPH